MVRKINCINAINMGQKQLKEENLSRSNWDQFCTTLLAMPIMTAESMLSKRQILGITVTYFFSLRVKEIKTNNSSLYSRYYADACNEWRNPSMGLSTWATHLRGNNAAIVSR